MPPDTKYEISGKGSSFGFSRVGPATDVVKKESLKDKLKKQQTNAKDAGYASTDRIGDGRSPIDPNDASALPTPNGSVRT